MTLPIIISEEASAEFDEAFDYFEASRAGKGVEFAAVVGRALKMIANQPRMHQEVQDGVRKGAIIGFPFVVIYRPLADAIDVIAIFYPIRDPAGWQSRL